jgi:hypothetical protein
VRSILTKCSLAALVFGVFISDAMAQDKAAGAVKLTAGDASIIGPNARLQSTGKDKAIEWWTSVDTYLRWTANIPSAGRYRVQLNYSLVGNNNNGGQLEIKIGDQKVMATPKAGNGWSDYRTGDAGKIIISKPGHVSVEVRPAMSRHEYVMNLRSITLLPAETSTAAIDISGAPIQQGADGRFTLTAEDAEIDGMNAALELPAGQTHKNIGFWRDRDTSLAWAIDVATPGRYHVDMDYSLSRSSAGSKVSVMVGDAILKANPKGGVTWLDYKMGRLGDVTIAKPGEVKVVMKALSKPTDFILDLRELVLSPADAPAPERLIDIADKPIPQMADGSLRLNATDAEIDGQTVKLQGGEKKYLLWWNSVDSEVRWPVKVDKPGSFIAEFTYSLSADDRSQVEIDVAGQKVAATLEGSKDLDTYRTAKTAEFKIDKTGDFDLVLTSNKAPGGLVMQLRSLNLIPAPEK